MEFKDRLKQARKSAKLTGEALGERLGCSKQNVSHWEAGRFEPSIEKLVKLCEVLNVTADWLLLGASPESLSPQAIQFAKYYESLSPTERERLTLITPFALDQPTGGQPLSAVEKIRGQLAAALGHRSLQENDDVAGSAAGGTKKRREH